MPVPKAKGPADHLKRRQIPHKKSQMFVWWGDWGLEKGAMWFLYTYGIFLPGKEQKNKVITIGKLGHEKKGGGK